jgi:hypothetical protein
MHAVRVARYIARNSAVAVHGEKLVEFVATGLTRAADRLAYQHVLFFSPFTKASMLPNEVIGPNAIRSEP